MMEIKIWLPVNASAEFKADIDVEGKTNEELFNEFLNNCDRTGMICHHCSNGLQTDFEITDYVDDLDNVKDLEKEIGQKLNR